MPNRPILWLPPPLPRTVQLHRQCRCSGAARGGERFQGRWPGPVASTEQALKDIAVVRTRLEWDEERMRKTIASIKTEDVGDEVSFWTI